MSWATVIVGGVSLGVGIWQNQDAKKEQRKLQKQMTSFETSEYAYDMNQFAQHLAQNGFDAATLSHLTNTIDRSTANSTAALERLGGGPNMVSDILDQGLQAHFSVGDQNSAKQYENFNRYLNTIANLDANLGASWASQQQMLKDQKQAAFGQQQAGNQNIVGGINAGLQGVANNQQMKLYEMQLEQLRLMMQGSNYPSVRMQGQVRATAPANMTVAQPPASLGNLPPTTITRTN